MDRKRRREVAVAVIAVLAVGTAMYRVRSMTTETLEAEQASSPTSVQQRSTGMRELAEVDLTKLKASRQVPGSTARDPFRFKPKPAPQPPAPSRSAAPAPVVPTGPPPPPPIALKFIGTMDSNKTGPLAILTDTRGVYYGRAGDIIEGRYRVVRIGVESVELVYLDGRGRQTIRLSGQ